MSTNPGNAVGTNGAFGGRTSVNAFNDVLGMFSGRGVLQGWELAPSSGMTITVGGDGTTRDVAVAEDNIGNRTTIDNISGQPIEVEIPAAPASNSRIDLIVAYVDNPAQGSATVTDNYEACGLIVVSGTAAASPTAPDESDIRTAITTDGGAGTVAYYVVLGQVTVASGTTDIDSTMLTNGSHTGVTSDNVDLTSFADNCFVGFLEVPTSAITINTQTPQTLFSGTIKTTGEDLLFQTDIPLSALSGGNIFSIMYLDDNPARYWSSSTTNSAAQGLRNSRIVQGSQIPAGIHTITIALKANAGVSATIPAYVSRSAFVKPLL